MSQAESGKASRPATLFEKTELRFVEDAPRNHPRSIRSILQLGSEPQLAGAPRTRTPGHRDALWRIVARVTGRAKNGDQLAVAGIVMDMRTVQVLVLISAVGALVVGQIEQHQPVPTPF